MKILLFDNYDSFTYNLVHMVEKLKSTTVDVYRNDQIGMEEIQQYDKIILSPGPGVPKEAGRLLELITTYGASKSILGVCLGQQAIAEAYGGSLINLPSVFHGVATPIQLLSNTKLFHGLGNTISVGRYHSWVVDETTLPAVLQVTARDDNNYIMGLQHTTFDVQGVQFHPESILTPSGETIIRNWLQA